MVVIDPNKVSRPVLLDDGVCEALIQFDVRLPVSSVVDCRAILWQLVMK